MTSDGLIKTNGNGDKKIKTWVYVIATVIGVVMLLTGFFTAKTVNTASRLAILETTQDYLKCEMADIKLILQGMRNDNREFYENYINNMSKDKK